MATAEAVRAAARAVAVMEAPARAEAKGRPVAHH